MEFAALHPQRQDVFLLQRLAEAASRSGDEPLFVVCLLHQGFNAYADYLNQSAQREWEKVAGRFEEIVFNQSVEEITGVIASALNVPTDAISKSQAHELRQAMERTISLGWFGSAPTDALLNTAVRLYPLHPTVLPVLIRAFRRFAQNERSLFSFLLSNEPFGLQAFAQRPVREAELYRLYNFYDYVRANFSHRLAVQSYRSHWNLIESLIESFATEDPLQVKVLKTVGILNLLNDGDLLPTEDSVVCASAGTDHSQQKQVRVALEKLRTGGKRVLYDRGRARGLCLWPHTSVDLEKAYEDARRAIDTPQRVANLIKDYVEARPVVARRHYIETGNLRHYDVRYCSIADVAGILKADATEDDGIIVLPLCETEQERDAVLEFAKQPELKERPNWLIAVPQPLNNLASLLQEVQRWNWVSTNTPELNGDRFAQEEVARQKEAARSQLERRIQAVIGFKQLSREMSLAWFRQNRPLKIKDGRHLLEELSRIFEQTYVQAACIHNELVKIPWRRDVVAADAETYARQGLRHVTTFAVWIDADYVRRFGDPTAIQEYGETLHELRERAATKLDTAAATNLAPVPIPLPAQILGSLRKDHPRLLATAQDFARLREQVKSDPQLKKWHGQLAEQAKTILNEAPSRYESLTVCACSPPADEC